jgi:hypothetical protein
LKKNMSHSTKMGLLMVKRIKGISNLKIYCICKFRRENRCYFHFDFSIEAMRKIQSGIEGKRKI